MRRSCILQQRNAYQWLQIHGTQHSAVHSAVELYFTAMMHIMKLPIDCELHVRMVGMSEMRQMHWERKGQDRVTDVLTFPGSGSGTSEIYAANELLFGDGGEFDLDDDLQESQRNFTTVSARKELLDLGDIYICPKYIKARCRRFPNRNLKLPDYAQAAYVHAFLHALGYDHKLEEEFLEMTVCEKWLARNVTRSLERTMSFEERSTLFGNLL